MQNFEFPYERTLKTQLPAAIQALIGEAEAIADKAYAPYSHFKVGAALQLADGSTITGCNHENASYPVGICAERAALTAMDMTDKAKGLKAIAVTYKAREHSLGAPVAPCGMCRQAILEVQQWQGRPVEVYIHGPNGEVIYLADASYLLPFSFGSSDLHAAKANI